MIGLMVGSHESWPRDLPQHLNRSLVWRKTRAATDDWNNCYSMFANSCKWYDMNIGKSACHWRGCSQLEKCPCGSRNCPTDDERLTRQHHSQDTTLGYKYDFNCISPHISWNSIVAAPTTQRITHVQLVDTGNDLEIHRRCLDLGALGENIQMLESIDSFFLRQKYQLPIDGYTWVLLTLEVTWDPFNIRSCQHTRPLRHASGSIQIDSSNCTRIFQASRVCNSQVLVRYRPRPAAQVLQVSILSYSRCRT